MSLIKQDNIRDKWVDQNIINLQLKIRNNKDYRVKAI